MNHLTARKTPLVILDLLTTLRGKLADLGAHQPTLDAISAAVEAAVESCPTRAPVAHWIGGDQAR